LAVTIGVLLSVGLADAQTKYPSKFTPQIAETREVKEALAYLDEKFTDQVAEWIKITEIPAKSTFEQKRDEVGNVIGRRNGAGGGPTVVFAAHMDTVHPMDTDVRVTKKDGRLYAPGIFDNSASVANMLQAARALDAAKVKTKGDVIFIATVQEELGLNGMNHWLDKNPGRADMVVALDGGLGAVNYGALGIYWSWMRFHGEGSHTVSSRGKPHPGRAAAQCILDIYTIPLPGQGEAVTAVYNVGMLEGG
jgi:acetylornithine deacetylase/succinyl-diaminopimelate desuccinylase-like protein